jgi:hypothetical protein
MLGDFFEELRLGVKMPGGFLEITPGFFEELGFEVEGCPGVIFEERGFGSGGCPGISLRNWG